MILALGWMVAFAADVENPQPAARPEAPAMAPAAPDRSAPPPVPVPELLRLPEPELHQIGPGVVAWYVHVPGVRKVAVHAVIGRGFVEFDGMPNQVGRATGTLADVAAGDLTGAELSSQRDLYELELWSAAGLHDAEVTLTAPKEELGRALDLERLVLREPSYPKKDLKRWIRDQQLFYTVSGPSSQAGLARSAVAFGWFPADHPYGARPDLDQLGGVKSSVLGAEWDRRIHGAPITVIVTGDVAWEAVEPGVRSLVDGLGAAVEPGKAIPVPPLAATRVIAVDMPGQPQVAIRMRTLGPSLADPDLPAMLATNFVLGGQFMSRLNRNLREEKGFTYGAWSRFGYSRTEGSVTVDVDVETENVAATVVEIRRELQRLVDEPVPVSEIDAMRRSLDADWNRTFETADTAVSAYRRALSNQETVGDMRARLVKVGETTPEDLARVAAKWLSADQARLWVFVGDRKTLEPQITDLGVPVEWVDPSTAILGRF